MDSMMVRKTYQCLLVVCLCMVGCSSTKLQYGSYKGDVGAVAFANNEYTFYEDGRFTYQDYTDNSSDGLFSNYGEGTYVQVGSELTLDYDTIDTLQTVISSSQVPCTKEDTTSYHFTAIDADGALLSGLKVVPEGELIHRALMADLAKDDAPTNVYDGNYIPNVFTQRTDANGRVDFHFPKQRKPSYFSFGRSNPKSSLLDQRGILYPLGITTDTVVSGCHEYAIQAQYVKHRPIPGDRTTVLNIRYKGEHMLIKQEGRSSWRRYKKISK